MSNNPYKKHLAMAAGYLPAIVAIAMTLMVTGCKKFLDVPPKDKIPQATLFKDEQGFKDAIIGVYLGMDKAATSGAINGQYTTDLSMGMLSTMAYQYDNATTPNVGSANSFYNSSVSYLYADGQMRQEMDALWGGMYTGIANLNNILTQIDTKKSIFTGDNFNRIKGESVALRALFHFDLVRMFGQPPLTGANKKAIPYVRKFGIRPTTFSTVNEALDSCIADLLEAKELLAQTDTSAVHGGTIDPFSSYTQSHMNYWAVQALLARTYLYKGDIDHANQYAQAVIASNKFPLITSNVAAATNIIRDRTFSQEHVFAVYSSNIKNYNAELFDKTGNGAVPLRLTPAGKTALYATGSGSSEDYRLNSWFDNNNNSSPANVPSKFFQDANLPYDLQGIVPVIRVSEMYYIAAECSNRKSDIAGGVTMLNFVRQARGLNGLNASGITSTDSLSVEIMREYKKEFLQEGQTWFFYKRLNMDLAQATGTVVFIPADVYVFPLPDKEKEYNN